MSQARSKFFSTKHRGILSEWLAVAWLWLHGYRVLDRRHRNVMGEIDIIARRGQTIAFIEVKSIRAGNEGFPAVSYNQLRRIRRAAELYLIQRGRRYKNLEARFDLITVSELFRLEHREGAF